MASEAYKLWYQNNKERLKIKHKKYYKKYYANPAVREGYWVRQIMANYGITPEQYQAMLERQGFKCAICETDKPGGKGKWHIDHCHDTKVVRGLLCQKCNMGLGHLKDSAELVEAALNYLQPRVYEAGNTQWF